MLSTDVDLPRRADGGVLRAPGGRVYAATPGWTVFVGCILLGWGVLGAVAVLGLDAMTDEITY